RIVNGVELGPDEIGYIRCVYSVWVQSFWRFVRRRNRRRRFSKFRNLDLRTQGMNFRGQLFVSKKIHKLVFYRRPIPDIPDKFFQGTEKVTILDQHLEPLSVAIGQFQSAVTN